MSVLEFNNPDKKLIVGVGSALIDILAHEDDAFIEKAGAAKGGMIYVDKDFIEQTLFNFILICFCEHRCSKSFV